MNDVDVGGWYYLHTNGSLIFKRYDFPPDEGSPFVRRVWQVNTTNRLHAWRICIEAAALGADPARIAELAARWKLTNEDATEFCNRANLCVLLLDGDLWCAVFDDFINLQVSKAGFGETALEALTALARDNGGHIL